MEIFNQDYDGGESMQGFSRDIDEALDEGYNEKMKLLPVDKYGFFDGTLNVRITFEPNANVSGPKGTPHDVVGQYLTGQCGSCRDFRSNGGSCESSNPAAYNGCWASLHPNADLTGPLGPERKP